MTGCYEYEFDCGNGECIETDWRCDGEDDCGNNADEATCTSTFISFMFILP